MMDMRQPAPGGGDKVSGRASNATDTNPLEKSGSLISSLKDFCCSPTMLAAGMLALSSSPAHAANWMVYWTEAYKPGQVPYSGVEITWGSSPGVRPYRRVCPPGVNTLIVSGLPGIQAGRMVYFAARTISPNFNGDGQVVYSDSVPLAIRIPLGAPTVGKVGPQSVSPIRATGGGAASASSYESLTLPELAEATVAQSLYGPNDTLFTRGPNFVSAPQDGFGGSAAEVSLAKTVSKKVALGPDLLNGAAELTPTQKVLPTSAFTGISYDPEMGAAQIIFHASAPAEGKHNLYTVEACNDLAFPKWEIVTQFSCDTGGEKMLIDGRPGRYSSPNWFYRLVVEEIIAPQASVAKPNL